MAERDLHFLKGPNGYYYIAAEGTPGKPGDNGTDGTSVYIAYASDSSGSGISLSPEEGLGYVAFVRGEAGLEDEDEILALFVDASWRPIGGAEVIVDDSFVENSTNPVQSKVIQQALDNKADSSHTHAQSDITGLNTALAGKADSSHTHAQSDITGLLTTLGVAVNFVDSISDVAALWNSDTALRGTKRVYIGAGENTTDEKDILLGHIYRLEFLSTTYTYTIGGDSETNPVPSALSPGEWVEITETAYEIESPIPSGGSGYPDWNDTYTDNDGDGIFNGPTCGAAPDDQGKHWGDGYYYTFDPDTSTLVRHHYDQWGEVSSEPQEYGILVPAYDETIDSSAGFSSADVTETEVVVGVEFVPNDTTQRPWRIIGERTVTGWSITVLWQDITPDMGGSCDCGPTTEVTALSGASGEVEPGKVYSLDMTANFTLSASTETDYGEAVVFVTPGSYTFSVASGITLSAEMTSGNRYRLLVSWSPFGVFVEQTGEWEVPSA